MPSPMFDKINQIYSNLDPLGQFSQKKRPSEGRSAPIDNNTLGEIKKELEGNIAKVAKRDLRRAARVKRQLLKFYRVAEERIVPEVDFIDINKAHSKLLDSFQRLKQTTVVNLNSHDEWSALDEQIRLTIAEYKSFMNKCWSEVDRFQKFKFDLWRYRLAIYGVIISISIFIIVNGPIAYANMSKLLLLLFNR